MTRNFQVSLEGRNFLVEMHGRVVRAGFFTSRRVVAEDGPTAEKIAIDAVQAMPDLRTMVRNDEADPPRIEVEKTVLLDAFEAEPAQPGLAWYAEDDDES
ncbi:MAG: hypothetical protein AAF196_11315 [Planctomycetota bacterium]